jgi:hypothetical protein
VTTPFNPVSSETQGEDFLTKPAIPLYFDNTVGNNKPIAGACIVMGMCLRNKSGVASNPFRLLDGGDAGGQPIYTAQLGAAQDLNPTFGTNGVIARNGLFTVDNNNSADGVVWVVPL